MPLCRQTAVGSGGVEQGQRDGSRAHAGRQAVGFAFFLPGDQQGRQGDQRQQDHHGDHQVPGADNSGRMPNPPAREPRIAPTVFQAKAVPTCWPRSFSPCPRSPINKGNCKPLTSAAGKTTIMAISDQLKTSPTKPPALAWWKRPA